jgi:hypothetical protein
LAAAENCASDRRVLGELDRASEKVFLPLVVEVLLATILFLVTMTILAVLRALIRFLPAIIAAVVV